MQSRDVTSRLITVAPHIPFRISPSAFRMPQSRILPIACGCNIVICVIFRPQIFRPCGRKLPSVCGIQWNVDLRICAPADFQTSKMRMVLRIFLADVRGKMRMPT